MLLGKQGAGKGTQADASRGALRRRAPLDRRHVPRAGGAGHRVRARGQALHGRGRARARRDRGRRRSRSASRPAVRSTTASCSTGSRARCSRPSELDRVLDGRPLDLAINLDVPREIVLDRIAGRRVCENCQTRVPREHAARRRLDVRHVRRQRRAARRRHRRGGRPPARALRAARRCRSSTTTATQGCSTSVDGVGEGDDVFERLVEGRDDRAASEYRDGPCARRRRRSR